MNRRRTFDEHGRPIVEVETTDGKFEQEIDTARVSELKGDELSLEDTRPMLRPNYSPYGDAPEPAPGARRRRSGLDYLRALSQEIKRRRRDEEPGE